ncbi:MAG: response regulator transcription factor [Acidobacteria bacterium]|nr:response regulator transcription factor [Acidobacteriota bacterium]
MTLRTLIVDDEPLARRRLKVLLKDEADFEIVGECEDGRSAIAAVRRHAPDLMLLDVQMPGMSGFDVIAALGAPACPAVIFVTAYDQYALKAFEVHAIDYLLKPFDRDRLRQALTRARRLVGREVDVRRALRALLSDIRARPLERLAIRSRGKVQFVRADEVDWIEASGHYLSLHAGRDTHLIRDTISGLEGRLDPDRFVRIHRSAIVNVDRIAELQPSFHGEYAVVLRDGTRLSSSRAYSARLRLLLEP